MALFRQIWMHSSVRYLVRLISWSPDKPAAAGLAGLRSILGGPNSPPPTATSSSYPTARPTSPGNRRSSGDRPRSPTDPQTFTAVRAIPRL